MHKRHYAQRQHIIHSLDGLCYQMHTLSFFLSPSIWAFVCRILCQSQCSKPSEVESGRSLRLYLAMLLFFNTPALWSHATEGAAQGRGVLLDFIGMAYVPSKVQLLALDFFIIILQMVLTIISYETVLWQNTTDADSEDILVPTPTSPFSSTLPSPITSSRPPMSTSSPIPNHSKPPPASNEISPYIVDLRFRSLLIRLRNPAPTPRVNATDTLLPLPNTTPWPLPAGMRMLLRAGAQMGRGSPGAAATAGTADGERPRTLPGTLDTRDS